MRRFVTKYSCVPCVPSPRPTSVASPIRAPIGARSLTSPFDSLAVKKMAFAASQPAGVEMSIGSGFTARRRGDASVVTETRTAARTTQSFFAIGDKEISGKFGQQDGKSDCALQRGARDRRGDHDPAGEREERFAALRVVVAGRVSSSREVAE